MTAPEPKPLGDPPPAHLDPNYQPPAAGAPPAPPPPAPGAAPAAGSPPPAQPAGSAEENFGQGSGVDLAPVAEDMSGVKEAASTGGLRMDEETAIELLRSLSEIRDRVEAITEQAEELDVPLKFGDNWVAHAMSKRLHSVAQGRDSAAIRVLKQFRMVIDDYESTVRAAAYLYSAAEEDVQSEMRQAARRLGMAGVFEASREES